VKTFEEMRADASALDAARTMILRGRTLESLAGQIKRSRELETALVMALAKIAELSRHVIPERVEERLR
jgi:hypothetical protein